jgi:hypothetical protein
MRAPKWHGTAAEARALLEAIAHNCTCERDVRGAVVKRCEPHRILLEDQRVLDWLAYGRHMADRFWHEEMDGPAAG